MDVPTVDLIPPKIRQKLSDIKPKEKKRPVAKFLDKFLDKKFINNYFNKK